MYVDRLTLKFVCPRLLSIWVSSKFVHTRGIFASHLARFGHLSDPICMALSLPQFSSLTGLNPAEPESWSDN